MWSFVHFPKLFFPQAYFFFLHKESSSLDQRSSAKWKIDFLLNHYFHIRRDRAEWIFIKLIQIYMYIVMHESQGEQLLYPCNGRLILNMCTCFWSRILDFIKNYLLSWQQLTFLSLPADQETERRNPLFTLTSKISNVSFFQLVQYGAKWYLKS